MNYTKYWIALEQTKGMGPAHLMEIYKKLESLNLSIIDLIDLSKDEILNEFKFNEKIADLIISSFKNIQKIENDYSMLIESGVDVIPFFSRDYPVKLFETMDNSFPPILYCYGNIKILKSKGIAILGDKDISEKGKNISYLSAKILARHKITCISGFAEGADMTAHCSSLENNGFTIAVVPFGVNHLKFPKVIENIFDPERLLIISPFYPALEANKFNGFIRNKIACALSHSVFIIEAPEKGGIFEAVKSAEKLKIPIFTTEYKEYPESAMGNKIILDRFNGRPVKGRMENKILMPNLDEMIGILKFEE